MSPRSDNPGFTLMEMLVVISLIVLLISMLQPALQSSRHNARIAICANNQRNLSIAVTTYSEDARFYPVGIDAHANNNERIWLWPTLTRMYNQKEQDVYACPQAPANTRWVKQSAPGEPAYAGYEANEMRVRGYTHKFSYGYNVWGAFMSPGNTGMGVYKGHPTLDAAPLHSMKQADDMIVFADSNPNDFWSGYIGPYRTGQWPSRIHFGKANVAFLDNHVTLMSRTELTDVTTFGSPNNKRWNRDHSFNAGTIQNDGVPDFP